MVPCFPSSPNINYISHAYRQHLSPPGYHGFWMTAFDTNVFVCSFVCSHVFWVLWSRLELQQRARLSFCSLLFENQSDWKKQNSFATVSWAGDNFSAERMQNVHQWQTVGRLSASFVHLIHQIMEAFTSLPKLLWRAMWAECQTHFYETEREKIALSNCTNCNTSNGFNNLLQPIVL